MTKKNANKLLAAVVAVSVLFLVAVVLYGKNSVSYEKRMLSMAGARTESLALAEVNPFNDGEYYFTVEKNPDLSEDGRIEYVVDDNGYETICTFPTRPPRVMPEPEDISEPSKECQKIIAKSKNLVCKYIDKSTILVDKERLKQCIQDTEVLEATYTSRTQNVEAYFSDIDGKIYINRNGNPDYVCESVYVHELIHVLAYYTRDGGFAEPEFYGLTQFDEAMTDQIAESLNPQGPKNGAAFSGYTVYYDFTAPYIDMMGDKALKAYFYGYDEVEEEIGKDEFELYVKMIENYDDDSAKYFSCMMVLKWYHNSEMVQQEMI